VQPYSPRRSLASFAPARLPRASRSRHPRRRLTKLRGFQALAVLVLLLVERTSAGQNPTYFFDTGTGASRIDVGGNPADANVAASRTHVCVTARAAFACYTKGGQLVSPGPGLAARPYTAKQFFESFPGIGTIVSVNGDTNFAKDGRVVFDQAVLQRFFLVFQSREATARLLIAVSRSEDPRDGWWAYADTVGAPDQLAHDYQRIGVNATHLLVSNNMISTWMNGSFTGTRHLLYPAADLAAGRPLTRTEWSHPSAHNAVPCTHDTRTTDAFWVHRDDDTHMSVWGLRNGVVTGRQVTVESSTPAVDGVQLGGTPIVYTNIGRAPQNAQYRRGKIVLVSNDGHTWSDQSSPNNAVRLVQLDVSRFYSATSPSVAVERDRIFGRASTGDRRGAIFDYGWPAVAANELGDVVVGSVRSNSTIFPNLRGSVWFAGQPDIAPSVSIATSTSPLSQWHMAGASADPSTSGVYLAQQFGTTSPPWRIRVVKMLGEVLPDLIATKVTAPTTIVAGTSGSVRVTILNQGDASMPASLGELRLSTDNVITTGDTLLATFLVPALALNQVFEPDVPFTAPSGGPLSAYVGVILDSTSVAMEYSEANNANPFLAGNHGNQPISIIGFAGKTFRRGDANGNGKVDLSDAIFILAWLFSGGDAPACLSTADSNDTGEIDISDAITTLSWLFLGGKEPPDPGPFECGRDPTPDRLPDCDPATCR
jgi:hypothetical protein